MSLEIIPRDPINHIQWLKADALNPNDYNPNVVMTPELRLLEHSILEQGWTQPIIINRTDHIIIDGFHRWTLSRESAALRDRYHGAVPCAVLDITRAEAMMLTIRINRAKGSPVALRLNTIIKELIDTHGLIPEQIMKGIGATKQEVDLLYQDGIFKHRNLKEYKYSKAWIPVEG